MKYLIIISLFFSVTFASANPSWWHQLEEKKDEIIGYGNGATLEVARSKAMRGIAETISSKIESDLTIAKETKSDGTYSKNITSYLKVSTSEKLNDLKTIRAAEKSGKWYVAVSYEWTTFAIKFKNKLKGYKLKDQKQNNFLANTSIVKNLNATIGKNLNYKLYRKKNVWHIAYDDVSFNLDRDEFSKMFAFRNSKVIDVELNNDQYEDGNKLILDVSSNKKGYISILYIGSDGQVGLLKDNLKINKSLTYPKDERIDLKNNSDKDKKFMIAVLFSEDKIQLRDFDKVNTKDIKNNNFTKLLTYFDKYEFMTYMSHIAPKE